MDQPINSKQQDSHNILASTNNNIHQKIAIHPIRVDRFEPSFPVNQLQEFYITLISSLYSSRDVSVIITNQSGVEIDRKLEWLDTSQCKVLFQVPTVGLYNISIELNHFQQPYRQPLLTKAYDLSKVFIFKKTTECSLNETYEFKVDASEAGEGQLEIEVNEGEIPNQVQLLDDGKCIVNFVPEECVPHVVDIKFNGTNVNGCPFIVDVKPQTLDSNPHLPTTVEQQVKSTIDQTLVAVKPELIKEERILINTNALFSLENLNLDANDQKDILIIDPEGQQIGYKSTESINQSRNAHRYVFEFMPSKIGEYSVELRERSNLPLKLPPDLLNQFPFAIKVFDSNKVLVSHVTDGVVGQPIYFFIDASQADSGNLEIRVSSKNRSVLNYPQSEANAKIRVNFTPTEALPHSIDVKFNGVPVPGNPFQVQVAEAPQAILPASFREQLKYYSLSETITFPIEYIGTKENGNLSYDQLTNDSCQVYVLRPDFVYAPLEPGSVLYVKSNKVFNVTFKPNKIGPHKLFIIVNNELIPASPVQSNVYNIDEVKVTFECKDELRKSTNSAIIDDNRPFGVLNEPLTFTVDALRAGEGTLQVDVVSGPNRNPVRTEVSEKGNGLYNLTFVPTEFVTHAIDMTFNDQVLKESPFNVDILDKNGKLASQILDKKTEFQQNGSLKKISKQEVNGNSNGGVDHGTATKPDPQLLKGMAAMSVASQQGNAQQQQPKTSSDQYSGQHQVSTTSRKSLAYCLVNSNNIIYLESGILENSRNQISVIGPNNELVPFVLGRGSPQRGEPKKTFIEYKPKIIGTHTIVVLENGKDLRQYYVETCDPSLIRIEGLVPKNLFVGKPVVFYINSQDSGEIQLDNITILGPKSKIRDGEHTILGRIKSMSSSGNPTSPLEYSVKRISHHKQAVEFMPLNPGRHLIEITCLGQLVGPTPLEIEVLRAPAPVNDHDQLKYSDITQVQSNPIETIKSSPSASSAPGKQQSEDQILQDIVVHGVGLNRSPVNSTSSFIIETNRFAQAQDFDVLITDPNNSPVDSQCYLQQDGSLLNEWIPRRIGPHKIEVLFRDKPVPGSPFKTEAFDPSSVIISSLNKAMFNVGDAIEIKINRQDAGQGELEVSVVSPVRQELPIDVTSLEGELGELISFMPPVAGKYKLSILFGGFEVPKSPIVLNVKDKHDPIKVTGTGLRCVEVNRTAQFNVENATEGQLKVRIESADREIVPKIEERGSSYTIKFKPTEIGFATISIYWNGCHVEGSPFVVPVNDLSKILFLSGSNKSPNGGTNQRIIDYEPNIPKEITVDTSKCGPGDLKAEAYCRASQEIKFCIPVDQIGPSRFRLFFACPPSLELVPKGVNPKDISSEATYLIRFYYNGLCVPQAAASIVVSPLLKTKPSAAQPPDVVQQKQRQRSTTNNNNNNFEVECPIVSLKGHGLADPKRGEKAEFVIDGSSAGSGEPEVRLNSQDDAIEVKLENVGPQLYKASYVAQRDGTYTLNVLWGGKQVAGCPIAIQVQSGCDPSKVICSGDGLKGGVLGEDIKVFIDTRRAGPGELTALCTGPEKVALCELVDRADGTFVLHVKPQESGRQMLTVKYAGQHIPKSPFSIKVSGRPDPTKVRVFGPGIEHGVLSLYQSRFICDTKGAGAGQLTVRIRGPKGAFRMETQRESQRDRRILCKYDPTEPGDYRIEIKWSDQHVPGSPFSVMIFDTQEELNRYLALSGGQQQVGSTISNSGSSINGYHSAGNKLSSAAAGTALHHNHHQVPYQHNMVDYDQYSKLAPVRGPPTSAGYHQPHYRL